MTLLDGLLARLTPRLTWAAVALACFGSVALAVFAQHRFDMQPCPWCVLQRVIFLAIGGVALAGLIAPARAAQALLGGVGALLSLCGAAAALYQNLVAAKSASCALSLADRIVSGLGLDRWQPEVFEVRANCAEAAVSILGVPFEIWSLLLYLALAAAALWLALGRPGARRG
ncbi:MAG TPA: disulfide bond formation protein B [Burkholderiaceae bacterium]|nr:disulfide bond formation protein B [Burkholderiaceae bacterium]HNG80722.1 disulfide bond formation protein B [Burkholderiaceae bacterium]